jgi:hypothetical protein
MQITAHMINAPDTPLRPNTQKVLRDLNLSSDRAFSRAEVLEAMRKAIPPVDASVRMAVDMELSQIEEAERLGKVKIQPWPANRLADPDWSQNRRLTSPREALRATIGGEPQLPAQLVTLLERAGVTDLPIAPATLSSALKAAGVGVTERLGAAISLGRAGMLLE